MKIETQPLNKFTENTWVPSNGILPDPNNYVLTYWYQCWIIAEIMIPSDKRNKPYWSSQEGEKSPILNGAVSHFMILSDPENK